MGRSDPVREDRPSWWGSLTEARSDAPLEGPEHDAGWWAYRRAIVSAATFVAVLGLGAVWAWDGAREDFIMLSVLITLAWTPALLIPHRWFRPVALTWPVVTCAVGVLFLPYFVIAFSPVLMAVPFRKPPFPVRRSYCILGIGALVAVLGTAAVAVAWPTEQGLTICATADGLNAEPPPWMEPSGTGEWTYPAEMQSFWTIDGGVQLVFEPRTPHATIQKLRDRLRGDPRITAMLDGLTRCPTS